MYEAKLEFPEGWGAIWEIPSVGGYGYFLEPHITKIKQRQRELHICLPLVQVETINQWESGDEFSCHACHVHSVTKNEASLELKR